MECSFISPLEDTLFDYLVSELSSIYNKRTIWKFSLQTWPFPIASTAESPGNKKIVFLLSHVRKEKQNL